MISKGDSTIIENFLTPGVRLEGQDCICHIQFNSLLALKHIIGL